MYKMSSRRKTNKPVSLSDKTKSFQGKGVDDTSPNGGVRDYSILVTFLSLLGNLYPRYYVK